MRIFIPKRWSLRLNLLVIDFNNPTRQVSQDYHELLTATSSAIIEKNIPGRELRWIVYEKKSGKILGFIRFGSPTINSKPRK